MRVKKASLLAAGTGAWMAGRHLLARARAKRFFKGKRVLITGGGSGLGLELTRQLLDLGAKVTICGRSADKLKKAVESLGRGKAVEWLVCDVGNREQVAALRDQVLRKLGGLDVLVNNAGIIQVGPVNVMERRDFENSLNTMFWGAYNTIEAFKPQLTSGARIVNITSFGGVVSVPHMLPYSVAKAAAFVFSEGLHEELKPQGVRVTTVVPGLMRTGSHHNAIFKGKPRSDYRWFALGASLPGISVNARSAARSVLHATAAGEAICYVGLKARVARITHALFEPASLQLLSSISRAMDLGAAPRKESALKGSEVNRRTGKLTRKMMRGAQKAVESLQPQLTRGVGQAGRQ